MIISISGEPVWCIMCFVMLPALLSYNFYDNNTTFSLPYFTVLLPLKTWHKILWTKRKTDEWTTFYCVLKFNLFLLLCTEVLKFNFCNWYLIQIKKKTEGNNNILHILLSKSCANNENESSCSIIFYCPVMLTQWSPNHIISTNFIRILFSGSKYRGYII